MEPVRRGGSDALGDRIVDDVQNALAGRAGEGFLQSQPSRHEIPVNEERLAATRQALLALAP